MKKSLLIILLIVAGFGSFGQNFQWARVDSVYYYNSYPDFDPFLILDGNGSVFKFSQIPTSFKVYDSTTSTLIDFFDPTLLTVFNSGGKLIKSHLIPGKVLSAIHDKKGNLYCTGSFYFKYDFDSGKGSAILNPDGGLDVFVLKYSSTGKLIFALRIGGTSEDIGKNIDIDNNFNIIVNGTFDGLVDFDPGTATYKINGPGSFNLTLDSSGKFISVNTNKEYHNKRIKDSKENIYNTGTFSGKRDFDPDPTKTFYLTSNGSYNRYIQKLDPKGNLIWAKLIGGNLYSIAIDQRQNVYTAGYFFDSIDLDPGSNYHYIGSNGKADIFMSKLDSLGNFVWGLRVGGTENDIANLVTIDDSSNLYFCGFYRDTVDIDPGSNKYKLYSNSDYDIFILKLNPDGKFIWVKTLVSKKYKAFTSIAIDKQYSIYLAGFFEGTLDFNPDTAKYEKTTKYTFNPFMLKLGPCPSPAGAISGPATFCGTDIKGTYSIIPTAGTIGYIWRVPQGASIDSGQNTTKIKVTFGSNYGTISVRPINTCDTNSYSSLTVKKFELTNVMANVTQPNPLCSGQSIKLFGSGALNYIWSGGISNNQYFTIDTSTTYIVTGIDKNGCEGKDTISLTVYVKSPPLINGPTTVCSGGKGIYSITPIKGAKSYTWKVPAYAVIDSGQYTTKIYVTFGNASAGYIEVNPTNACSPTFTYLNVSISAPKIGIDVTPTNPVCKGSYVALNGKGGSNYTWSGGIKNGIPFILDTTTVFTVTDSSSSGCTGKNSILIKVNPLPKVGVYSPNPSSLCSGVGTYLYGTGAYTYTWSDGILDGVFFKPVSTKTYIVTGTDINGCKGISSYLLSVLQKPTISLQPVNQTGKVGDTIKFKTSTTSSTATFQWQQNGGIGFVNLFDAGPYLGVNTNTLAINSVALNQNNFKYQCIIFDNDCIDTTNIASLYVKVTGIKNEANQNSILIYPNPANSLITIESNHTLNNFPYTITDQTGRQILNGNLNSKINAVDVRALDSGFYFLQIGETSKETFKILKQ